MHLDHFDGFKRSIDLIIATRITKTVFVSYDDYRNNTLNAVIESGIVLPSA